MSVAQQPLTSKPVPAFPGWWRALGPGIVWMALAQGSGELIWWPYLTAKYGLAFVFLLVPACLLQYPVNIAIGRYTLATGESIMQGFLRLHRGFAIGLWVMMAVSFLWFGAFASAGGTALADLTHFPNGWTPRAQSLFWGYVTMAVFFAAIAASRVIYRFIERFMMVAAIGTAAGLLLAVRHPDVSQYIPEFARALVIPQLPPQRAWDPKDASKLLTAVAFAGLGGFWTLLYSYWLREKGAGMASYVPKLEGLRQGHSQSATVSGAVPGDTPQDAANWRRWTRDLGTESLIGIVGNLATTLMTCLLAYALLHPQGLLPEGDRIAVEQARFFEAPWGALGRVLFLVVAAAFLADTWLATADAVSRVHADFLLAVSRRARKKSPLWWYMAVLIALTAVTGVTMLYKQPGVLIQISAVIGFVGTVIYAVALWILNHRWLPRHLPAHARPSTVSAIALGLAILAYATILGIYLWLLLGK